MCKNFNMEWVMIWHLILEEYGPTLHYMKGEHNIVADALSHPLITEPLQDPKNTSRVWPQELWTLGRTRAGKELCGRFPSVLWRNSGQIRTGQWATTTLKQSNIRPHQNPFSIWGQRIWFDHQRIKNCTPKVHAGKGHQMVSWDAVAPRWNTYWTNNGTTLHLERHSEGYSLSSVTKIYRYYSYLKVHLKLNLLHLRSL